MSDPAWFDENYYLQQKADQLNADLGSGQTQWTIESVLQAMTDAGLTPLQHYAQYGVSEELNPNQYFDQAYYLSVKTDQLNATAYEGRTDWTSAEVLQEIQNAGLTPYEHFAQYGVNEGLNPSADFDVQTYLADKAEQLNESSGTTTWTPSSVLVALEDAGLDPVSHYMEYGSSEGLTPTPANDGGDSGGGGSGGGGGGGGTSGPTTTVGITGLSADTGSSGSDYITKTASQTITATLSAALQTGETLWGSVDGGVTWTNITATVTGTDIAWDGVTLLGGTHTIAFKVKDASGNYGTVATHSYTMDTSAPATPTFALWEDTGTSGDGITSNGIFVVSGIETGATWQYSVDGGTSWVTGTGTMFTLDNGEYDIGKILVKQTDTAGNASDQSSNASLFTIFGSTYTLVGSGALNTVTGEFSDDGSDTYHSAQELTANAIRIVDRSGNSLSVNAEDNTTGVTYNSITGFTTNGDNLYINNTKAADATVFTGSDYDDTVTVSATHSSNQTYDGGSGNDTLVIIGTVSDTISISTTNGAFRIGGTQCSTYSNFENLDLSQLIASGEVTATTCSNTTSAIIGATRTTLVARNTVAAMTIDASALANDTELVLRNTNSSGGRIDVAAVNITGLTGNLEASYFTGSQLNVSLADNTVDDTITVKTGTGANTTVSGGAAGDTVTVNMSASGSDSSADTVSVSGAASYEIIEITGAAGNTLNFSGSAASTVVIDTGNDNDAIINNTGTGILSIVDNGTDIDGVNALVLGGAGAFAVSNFGHAAHGIALVTLADSFTGTIALTMDYGASAILQTGAAGASLPTSITVDATLSGYTLSITGENAVTVNNLKAANGSVDASGSTGAVTVNATADNSGHSITGGSGNDTLSVTGSGTNGVQLSGGAGNDTITGGAGADTITGGLGADVLTGGGGADVFKYVADGDSGTASFTGSGSITFTVSSTGLYDVIHGDSSDTIDLAGYSEWHTVNTTVLANGSIDQNTYATDGYDAFVFSDSGNYYLAYETSAGTDGSFGTMKIVELSGIVGSGSTFAVAATGVVSFS